MSKLKFRHPCLMKICFSLNEIVISFYIFTEMLTEYPQVRQIENEATRRWFSDENFDLIVWFDDKEAIIGFQLCYDISHQHRAVTWRKETGYTHHRVDDGENRPGKIKSTPILVADGLFDRDNIAAKFEQASTQIDKRVSSFVYDKLLEYPEDSVGSKQ